MAKTLRTGIIRSIDNLGRLVIAKGYRRLGGFEDGTAFMQTALVDQETGRLRGILLEPVEWIAGGEKGPEFSKAVARALQVNSEGPEVDA